MQYTVICTREPPFQLCNSVKGAMLLYLFREVYDVLVKDGTIVPKPDKNPPTVPMDYSWAQASGNGSKELG